MEALRSPPEAPPAANAGRVGEEGGEGATLRRSIFFAIGSDSETVGQGQLFVTRPPVNSLTEAVPLCKVFFQHGNYPEGRLLKVFFGENVELWPVHHLIVADILGEFGIDVYVPSVGKGDHPGRN